LLHKRRDHNGTDRVPTAGWALTDAAAAVTDRAIAVQLDRGADFEDKMAVGLALHGAAAVLEADSEQL